MTPDNIVATFQELTLSEWDDRSEWEQVLSEGLLPTEEQPAFREYCNLFFRYAKKSPYHTKKGYEQGFVAKTKKYKHTGITYYPRAFEKLVVRHLDAEASRPYWLGLRFGRKSMLKCIDFDNKSNVIGHYKCRDQRRPVVHLPLTHFKRMKRLYDAFPNHIWCVSSATLGLHVWEKLHALRSPEYIEEETRPKLKQIGLENTEVYPSPSTINNVLRRPFGLDYHTITDEGDLTDWIEQTNHFVTARRAPSFPRIVKSLLALAEREWEWCNQHGGLRPSRQTPFVTKRVLRMSALRAEVAEVASWVRAGCPDDPTTSSDEASGPVGETMTVAPWTPKPRTVPSPSRWTWAHVKALAREGVPEEHKLYQYLLLLARPLVWRDYFHLKVNERLARAEADLLFWVMTKHNGLVTRVQEGDHVDLRHEVRRQVRVAHEETSPSLQAFYAEMRERDKQYPARVERVSDLIRNIQNSSSFPVCCRRISKEMDDSPLPAHVEGVLSRVVKDKKMRRRDGEYPFVRFARRLLNALWAEDGAASLHGEVLLAFCGSKNPNQVVGYKKLMAEYGLISDQWEGHVQKGVSSALYQMTDATFEQFQTHHGASKTKKKVRSPFKITAMTEAKLDAMDWGW